MTPTHAQLFQVLAAARLNQSAAARVLGVSRETVRQWLLPIGGVAGLIAMAAQQEWASKEELSALTALAVLAPASRQGANRHWISDGANMSGTRHLRSVLADPTFAANMGTATAVMPQTSTVRLDGAQREFAKRVALEVALKAGLPREDVSGVLALMIDYFRRDGDPATVAQLLLGGEKNGGSE
jgi:hypothetical protein